MGNACAASGGCGDAGRDIAVDSCFLVDAGKESDLLICESYVYSTPVNKHLSYETVAARLSEINPKRVLLTHLNQDMLDRLAESKYPAARDGMIIDLH